MAITRNITYKYKDFNYTDDVKELISIELNVKQQKKLDEVYLRYEELGSERGYEFIIADIF